VSTAVFATRDALEAEIARLGVAIRLQPDIQVALTPIRIGARTAGNRFAIHPMEGCDGTLEGAPDELTIRRWSRFATGGAKLLWGEAVAIDPAARANTRQLLLSEENLPALERLIALARREHGPGADTCLIGLQLTHSGRWSYPTPVVLFHDPALRNNGRILTDSELDRLQDRYVGAALRARDIGVDFVDIKQCHRYLLSEMLAARTRPGKYGGSLENRTRFVREILERLASEAPELIRATRMNFFDGVPFAKSATGGGEPIPGATENYLQMDEAVEALRIFEKAGLQLVNVTAGCPYFNPHVGRPADREPPDGYAAPEPGLVGVERHFKLAEAAQRACPTLPVIGTGYSYLRHFAVEAGEANLRAGSVSLVGLGRGAIAYPDFARDVQMDKRKACITVSYCTTLMRAKDNELGQYAAGCVPRDPVYARLLQVIQKDAKRKAASLVADRGEAAET
jgi:NADPH2 dehydrogenase